jgi:hypothetical protein
MARYHGSLKPDFDLTDFRTADGNLDFEGWMKAEEDWIKQMAETYRKLSKGDLVGQEVRWQRADGYARYMVVKQRPLTLAHLSVGDAWWVEGALIRGLRVKDIREMNEARDRLAALFASQKTGT